GLAGILASLPAATPAVDWDWAALGQARAARSPRYTSVIDGLLRALRETLPADGIVVADQSGLNYWMEWHLPLLAPRTFLYLPGPRACSLLLPHRLGAAGLERPRRDRRQDRVPRPCSGRRRRRRRPTLHGAGAGHRGEVPTPDRLRRHERSGLRRDPLPAGAD